jgi:hypothetical protein
VTLRPTADAKPLDAQTAARIGRAAHADTVQLGDGGATYGFALPAADEAVARGHVELAARFELGAHWQTRYEIVAP